MYKGLTKRAQRVLTILAQEEARRFHSPELAPEHVLLALLSESDNSAYKLVSSLKINIKELVLELERSASGRKGGFLLGDAPLSRRLKSMLETAAEEARQLDSEYIGTEHLIMAAARESGSVFEQSLSRNGIFYEQLRASVKFVGSGTSDAAETRSRSYTQPPKRPSYTPLLDEHSRDLSAWARDDLIDPIIGREAELRRIVRILSRRNKNNPVLIGDPGVGKTAIVEGLAIKMIRGEVPEGLFGKRLIALDMASIVAGTKYRGEFEDRLKRIMKEISKAGNIILFIDELHTIIGAGSAEGTIDASNMLKPALSRGEIQCIGATTLDEYRKYFEKDAALERRFQAVLVNEPNDEETLKILEGIKEKYERYHGISYSDEAIEACVKYAKRYLTERFLPDKAIDVMDEAGAKKKIDNPESSKELGTIEEEIKKLNEEKLALVTTQNYEKAAVVRDKAKELKLRLQTIRDSLVNSPDRDIVIGIDDIKEIVSDMTGIPLERITEGESEKLLSLEDKLHSRVVGQGFAVKALAAAVRRSRAGISDPRRPLGSFIFLGPTGVGKTLLAKTLAESLFGSEDALIRIDMSDFMEKHNASRLVGSPPGYVGYDEGGMLTERVRRRPYSVVLFDEIEKAHPDVFNLLLQLLEEGELQDNLGHTVSFRNCVIIMTSNAGTRDLLRGARLGFGAEERRFDYKAVKDAALSELKKLFNPEFLNRVDEVVVFHPLDKTQIRSVLELELSILKKRLMEKSIFLELDSKAYARLIEDGYDEAYGARPMKRLITKLIEDPLAVSIVDGSCPPGTVARVKEKDGFLSIKLAKPESKKSLVARN